MATPEWRVEPDPQDNPPLVGLTIARGSTRPMSSGLWPATETAPMRRDGLLHRPPTVDDRSRLKRWALHLQWRSSALWDTAHALLLPPPPPPAPAPAASPAVHICTCAAAGAGADVHSPPLRHTWAALCPVPPSLGPYVTPFRAIVPRSVTSAPTQRGWGEAVGKGSPPRHNDMSRGGGINTARVGTAGGAGG